MVADGDGALGGVRAPARGANNGFLVGGGAGAPMLRGVGLAPGKVPVEGEAGRGRGVGAGALAGAVVPGLLTRKLALHLGQRIFSPLSGTRLSWTL
jgi:hypothetical protein